MPNLTAAARRRLIVTAARGFDVKSAASLAAADAFVALTADGMSTRSIAAELVTAGALFAPAYGTVARYVKVRKALPADVTADEFVTALRAETAARSAAGKGNARANAAREGKPRPVTADAPAAAPAAPVTVADALALIASITTLAATFDAADQATVAAALMHAASATAPTVTALAA